MIQSTRTSRSTDQDVRHMRVIFTVVLLHLYVLHGATVSPPTFTQMWEAAQVVVVINGGSFEDTEESLTDLPRAHPNLVYRKSFLVVELDESTVILKGELTKDEEKYGFEHELYIPCIRAEKRYERELLPGEGFFGFAPFLIDPPEDISGILLFLKRGLYGNLEPVDPNYFLYYLRRSIEYRPNQLPESTEAGSATQ